MSIFIEGMACVGKTSLLRRMEADGARVAFLDYIELKERYPELNFADYRKKPLLDTVQGVTRLEKIVLKNLVSTFTYLELLKSMKPEYVDRSPFCGIIYEIIWVCMKEGRSFDYRSFISKELNPELLNHMTSYDVVVILEADFEANCRRGRERGEFDVSFHNLDFAFWQYTVFRHIANLVGWDIMHIDLSATIKDDPSSGSPCNWLMSDNSFESIILALNARKKKPNPIKLLNEVGRLNVISRYPSYLILVMFLSFTGLLKICFIE